jgi:hypothetical protein
MKQALEGRRRRYMTFVALASNPLVDMEGHLILSYLNYHYLHLMIMG